jgi:uncharacterized protein YcfJ
MTTRSLFKTTLVLAAVLAAGQASAQVTFYQRDGFEGRAYSATGTIPNLARYGLNDRASSVVVSRERWEVCEDNAFRGHCVVLRPGNYPSLAAMGLNNQISSVRPIASYVRIDDHRYAPPPIVVQDYRRRGGERLYEAPVVAVRAVVGPPEQRCWIEREKAVVRDRDEPNVPGAVVGAVIGGILGHQIGHGGVKDVATVGGAVAGAAIGANVGNGDGRQVVNRDVQRCSTVPSAQPAYWDVTYTFRGLQHSVQLTTPPGPTVRVNGRGEPRA